MYGPNSMHVRVLVFVKILNVAVVGSRPDEVFHLLISK